MAKIITRGNQVSFTFTFLSADGVAAPISSATVQLEYPGRDCRETENLTLTEDASVGTWGATWDSSKSRTGWVNYHAHAIDFASIPLTEGGRFKIDGNAAGYQRHLLPAGTGTFQDYE